MAQRTIPDIPQRDEFFLDEHHQMNPIWLKFFQRFAPAIGTAPPPFIRDVFANIPTGLGPSDEGTLFHATDYLHTWRWDGGSWRYLDEGDRSGRIEFFLVAPTIGWKLMDGTGNPVTFTTEVALTATTTLPNAIGAYLKGVSFPSTVTVPPYGGTMTGTTANETGHNHDAGTYHAIASPIGYTVDPGTTDLVSNIIHHHGLTGVSGPGSGHNHGAGTLAPAGDAEPQRYGALPYFRL